MRDKVAGMSHLASATAALGPDATLVSDPDITASYSRDHAPFAVERTAICRFACSQRARNF